MKLSFASNLNHAIESAMKMYQRTGLTKRWNRQGFLAGLVVMALAALLFPAAWIRKLLFGALMGTLFAVLYPEQCKKSIRKRIRKMIIQQRGTNEDVPFDIVLNKQGVEACWSNSRVAFPWNKVMEISEQSGAVDFYMEDNSVITAPPYAFTDAHHREQFLAKAGSFRETGGIQFQPGRGNMTDILLATRNAHKIQEIRQLLHVPGLHLSSLDEVPAAPEVVEDGATFRANAEKKARILAVHFNCWAMADDSGLEVHALGGAPGVHSARYAGEHGNDAANNEKLLRELEIHQDRSAQFICVLALSDPQGVTRAVTAACRGHIASAPSGEHGFGYDPLFVPQGYTQTFGVLGKDIKAKLSHRARAVKRAGAEWKDLLSG